MDNSLYARVNRQFNKRKKERDILVESRKTQIYSLLPRVGEIDESISGMVFAMFTAVSRGENADRAVEEFAEKLKALTEEKKTLIVRAGFEPDYLEPAYRCDICHDTGLAGQQQCRCYKELLTKELMTRSNLGRALETQSFETFSLDKYRNTANSGEIASPRENMIKILEKCRRFADTFDSARENLFFYGPPGLGKTFLSSAIANKAIHRGLSVVYQSAGQLFSSLEDIKFGRAARGEEYAVSNLNEAELLIIDDLGTEFITAFTEAELFKILNARILAGKSTIISTNLTLADVKKVYSERILSRILGEFDMLKFYGDDIRSK